MAYLTAGEQIQLVHILAYRKHDGNLSVIHLFESNKGRCFQLDNIEAKLFLEHVTHGATQHPVRAIITNQAVIDTRLQM
jgi:hypothetical protein